MLLSWLGGIAVALVLGGWARFIHEHTSQYWDAKGNFVQKEAQEMTFAVTVACVAFSFGIGGLTHQSWLVTAIAFIAGAVISHYIEKYRMKGTLRTH